MLVIVAKPGDEAEFFVPMIDYLRNFNSISVLALSNGENNGKNSK